MKWMLVVLVGGVTPVNTDLVFDKFSECLAAEEQMRQHYADTFDASLLRPMPNGVGTTGGHGTCK
jgi:hypothetical protein